jgi:shikimate dehydrogenase
VTRLAVLGSPIAHSKSPALHRAAYAALGLDWRYDAVEVADGGLAGFVEGLDATWRGLSLTMPLKREVLGLLDARTPLVEQVGAANTVLRVDGVLSGFNTDVPGIVTAFQMAGVSRLESVQVLGAGATAASVLAAVSELGATRALVSARDVEKAKILEPVAASLGMDLTIRRLGMMDRSMIIPSAVVSTLPGGTVVDMTFAEPIRRESVLFDIAYDPWPSALASSWTAVEGTVIRGIEMLLWQALYQVRIFVAGDGDRPLDDESRVVTAMRAAVGL